MLVLGAWGTGLFDDDTTCDVRDSFIDYLDEGNTAEEATQYVLEEYLDEFNPEEDLEVMSLVYIGLSAIQMKKNCLQEQIRKTTINLIEKGADLELWEDSDPKEYDERKKVLSEFKAKLINF